MGYLRLFCLIFLISTVAAQAASIANSTPSATSSPTLVQLGYGYTPSKAAAGVFTVLYAFSAVAIYIRVFANRAWWAFYLPIGASFMSAGFALRIAVTFYPNSLPIYVCSVLFVLLAPSVFLAFNYILYGRFVVNCIDRRHSLIKPERTVFYFVVSDAATLGLQSAGGSLSASTDPQTAHTGIRVVIAGLALQAFSFGVFIGIVYAAYQRLMRSGIKPFVQPWGVVLQTLFFSSAFFFLRSVYRTIELGQGLGNGYLQHHEVFFYVFDALPVLVGSTAFAVYWPSRYFSPSLDRSTSTTALRALHPPLPVEEA